MLPSLLQYLGSLKESKTDAPCILKWKQSQLNTFLKGILLYFGTLIIYWELFHIMERSAAGKTDLKLKCHQKPLYGYILATIFTYFKVSNTSTRYFICSVTLTNLKKNKMFKLYQNENQMIRSQILLFNILSWGI